MACTNPQNPNCPNCNKSGLAILPVRYAVVPKNIDATLPAPMGNKVTDVKLAHHKYALRTLRKGYIYILHEKHPRGSHIKWEVYSVTAGGTLWKQLSPEAMQPVEGEPACSRGGHNIPASVISIESPEKCKRIWIAFSEHPWSSETFTDFTNDAKLRDRRMQTFLPATWVAAGGYRHGLPATTANIEQVIEYKQDATLGMLNGATVPGISNEDGTHKQQSLEKCATRYPGASRSGQSGPLVKVMKEISVNPKGEDYTPIMIALWDSVGITHELNGFYHDAAGWVEKYNAEQDLKVSAMMAIEGLKNALSNKAAEDARALRQSYIDSMASQGNTTQRRANAAKLPEPQRSRELEVCDILDDWTKRKIPATRFWPRLSRVNYLSEPARSAEIAKIKQEVNALVEQRKVGAERNDEHVRKNAWEKYDEQLAGPDGKKLYQDFKKNYDKFLAAATELMNNRATDLVAWLESRYLVNALTEYHGANFDDGLSYDTLVGKAIFGIQSTNAGAKKLDAWVKEIKTVEHNLLWRSIALNQTEAMSELDTYLAEASKHAANKTPAGSLDALTTFSKSLKAIVDTYKKFVSFDNSNKDASSPKGSKAFGIALNPVNARGTDRVVMAAGDRIFGQFRILGLADYVSEKMIQHLFSIRALLTPGDSLKLLEAQVPNERAVRVQTLQMLRSAQGGSINAAEELKTKQAEALRKGWSEFKETNAKAANAVRDGRLALLIMLIEGVNFSKLLYDCKTKGDAKSWLSLAASGMTIGSALFDLATVPVKALAKGAGDSWSFQRLKLAGGLLSTAAAGVTAYIDFAEADKKMTQGQFGIARLYTLKAIVGVTGAGITFATTFTYSAPVLGRILRIPAISTVGRIAGNRAAAIIATRILFMSAGAWITIIGFGIQILIWVFTKNDLEVWCLRCAFGLDRKAEKRFRTAKEQTSALEDVMIGMGMAPPHETESSKARVDKILAQPRPSVDEMMMHD